MFAGGLRSILAGGLLAENNEPCRDDCMAMDISLDTGTKKHLRTAKEGGSQQSAYGKTDILSKSMRKDSLTASKSEESMM